MERGAPGAAGDEGGRGLELGTGRVTARERGHQQRVVGGVGGGIGGSEGVGMLGGVRHHPSSPRNSPMEPSSRSRSARRPRWIRDLTVPRDTPVISAISA